MESYWINDNKIMIIKNGNCGKSDFQKNKVPLVLFERLEEYCGFLTEC